MTSPPATERSRWLRMSIKTLDTEPRCERDM